MSGHAFGSGAPFSLGVEEELLLVRPGDGRPADAGEEVLDRLPDDLPGDTASELHACEVEIATPVVAHAGEAVRVLGELRAAIAATGAAPIGCGLQPGEPDGEAGITPKARYRRIRELLGDAAATPVAGMHVHVGMPIRRPRSARSTGCAATSRCCRRSPPTRRSATAATPGCSPRASSRCAPGCAPACRGRCATTTIGWR